MPFKTLKYFIFSIFTLMAFSGTAQAADDRGMFAISHVPVDVTARSATEARSLAIAEGQRAAFERLFRKLVSEEDQALMPALGNDELGRLVLSIDVVDEQSSNTRYLAKLNVAFDPGAVRRLLGDLGVSFAETRTRPTLVLPVLSTAGTDMLWSPRNNWFEAWRAYPSDSSLIDYVLPTHDIEGVALISPAHALSVRPEGLAAISRHYETSEILVAHATLDQAYPGGPARLRLSVTRGVAQQPVLSFAVNRQADEAIPALMARAIDRIDRILSEAWKQQVLVQYGNQATLEAEVRFTDFKEWRDIQLRLSNIAQIKNSRLDQISIDRADLVFDYFGGMDILRTALREQGLSLVELAGGGWRIQKTPKQQQDGPGEDIPQNPAAAQPAQLPF